MSSSGQQSTPTRSPINKWARLKTPPKEEYKKKDHHKTHVSLEYTLNPQAQEKSENIRLVVTLKAGIKDPKGFLALAWGGVRLREEIQ